MKKIKNNAMKLMVMTLCVMFSLVFIGNEAKAYYGDDDGIVTNVTETTCHLSWGHVPLNESEGYQLIDYAIAWWCTDFHNGEEVTFKDHFKDTECTITGLPSGSALVITVYGYYSDNPTERQIVTSASVDTKGKYVSPDDDPDYDPYSDVPKPSNPTKPTTPSTPTRPSTPSATTLAAPTIGKALLQVDRIDAVLSKLDSRTKALDWRVCDKKTGKVVSTDYSTSDIKASFSVSSRKIYYVQCRSVAYDADYNTVYSGWSAPYYVVSQPKITSKEKDIKQYSVKVKYKKISGVKDYTIYGRKHKTKKWKKIKTTKKASYTVKKIKGKGINFRNNEYDFCVVSNAKVGGKTIHSTKSAFTHFYMYFY